MGKKRIIKKGEQEGIVGVETKIVGRATKKKMESGVLSIKATYNNTRISLADRDGGTVLWTTSGSLGFKGAKKGTPFAAGKIGDLLADKAQNLGLKEVDVVISGVGAGRESALRAFAARGIIINSIKDVTPIPFNGPKPKKSRRV